MSNVLCQRMAVGEEASFGTVATSWVTNAFVAPTGLTANSNIITPENEINGSVGIPYQSQVKASYMGEGSIPMNLRPSGINPLLMKMFLGGVSTTALGSGAYSHSFTLSDICDELPSFSLYEDLLTQKKRWLGCRIGSLNCTQAIGEFGSFEWGVIAQKDEDCSAPTMTERTARPVGPADLVVTMNSVAMGAQNINFGISNGLEADFELNGSMFPTGSQASTFAIDGAFERKFIDMLLERRFWGTAAATSPQESIMDNTLTLTWTSTEDIGGGNYYTVIFDFKNITLLTVQPQMPGPGSKLTEPVTWNATQDASGDILEVTIINEESAIGI